MSKIIPAILTNIEDEYHKRLLLSEHVSDLIQIDIVDGNFAKNKTIGLNVVKKYPSSSFLEIDLLVEYPQNYIDELMFTEHVSRIIVPFECAGGLPEAIYHVKNHGKQVGVSLNPDTPVGATIHFFDDIDFLRLLAVNPGFPGQKFQEVVYGKIKQVKNILPELPVEIDGGINKDNISKLSKSGADYLAVNSALFKAEDFMIAYEKLAKLAQVAKN